MYIYRCKIAYHPTQGNTQSISLANSQLGRRSNNRCLTFEYTPRLFAQSFKHRSVVRKCCRFTQLPQLDTKMKQSKRALQQEITDSPLNRNAKEHFALNQIFSTASMLNCYVMELTNIYNQSTWIFGTRRSIWSVTRQPFRLRTLCSSTFRRMAS